MPMTSSGTAKVTLPADDQILITREFDAPKHLVFKAWTTPDLVKRWWHANRGEVTIAEIDLRVGGKWRYVGESPDGQPVAFHGEYREIVPNERIVSTEAYEGRARPRRERDRQHADPHRGGRTHDAVRSRARSEQGSPRRDHRLRHGSRHAGRPRPPRAGRGLAALTRPFTAAGHARPAALCPLVVLVLVVAAPPLVRLRLRVALR